MIEIVQTADRLTIDNGNVKASVVGALVVLVILGAGLIGCSLVMDFQNSDIYREAGIPQTPWLTIVVSTILVLLMVLAPIQWHHRIVFDRVQGTMRLVRVSL